MFLNLIVAALATWQIIEIWHHSKLFAPARSRTEMWVGKLGDLLGCPYCLSPWVAIVCFSCLNAEKYFHADTLYWFELTSLVIYAFAASRLANLGNDFFKPVTLTPRVNWNEYFDDLDFGNEQPEGGDDLDLGSEQPDGRTEEDVI
jgi:hypothetical protein